MEPEDSLQSSEEPYHCAISWARWIQSTRL